MPALSVTPYEVSTSGIEPVYVAADANGHILDNDGSLIIDVNNQSGGSINVTIAANYSAGGITLGNLVVAVPSTKRREIGPFPPLVYNDTSGKITITYSAVGSVTVAFKRVPNVGDSVT